MKTQGKKQVKIVLPEDFYLELKQEAEAKGLTLSTYIRTLLYERDLPQLQNNGKMMKQKEEKYPMRMKRVPDLF